MVKHFKYFSLQRIQQYIFTVGLFFNDATFKSNLTRTEHLDISGYQVEDNVQAPNVLSFL